MLRVRTGIIHLEKNQTPWYVCDVQEDMKISSRAGQLKLQWFVCHWSRLVGLVHESSCVCNSAAERRSQREELKKWHGELHRQQEPEA